MFDFVEEERKSLINSIFSKEMMKALYFHACRVDIEDNNDKSKIIIDLLGDEFTELGTGTNRVALFYNPSDSREFRGGAGLVYEIALDRRGFVDNWTEFKRSIEFPEIAIKAYESNLLITVEEYVNLMDSEEFVLNENGIKEILRKLDEGGYIFEDIGFNMNNYENYGYRENGDIVILDLGYIYPIAGNEKALSCPRCKAKMRYNPNYTGFVCSNSKCRHKANFLDVRRRMKPDLENLEDQMLMKARNCEMPNLDKLNVF